MIINKLLRHAFILFTMVSGTSLAQPVSIGVFDDVRITRTDEGYLVESIFTCPVRYISHFPHTEGDEINIRIDPVPLCDPDSNAESGRGSIRPRSEIKTSLYEVVYDGDINGGPFLTLFFKDTVKFRVSQARITEVLWWMCMNNFTFHLRLFSRHIFYS